MTEFEAVVMDKLGKIESLATAAKLAAESAHEASMTATQAMSDRLFHEKSGVITTLQGDIQEIKEEKKTDDRWERIHNIAHYSLTPLVVFAHGVARHFGLDI